MYFCMYTWYHCWFVRVFFSNDDMKYMFDDDDCRDRNRHKSECSVKWWSEWLCPCNCSVNFIRKIKWKYYFVFQRITDIINHRIRSPWLWPSFVFNLSSIGRENNELLKVLHGFSQKVRLFSSSFAWLVLSMIFE